ncbi:Hypothetical protein NATL1_13051 [Prochlorococcus marinus str. NATL1A]|uniref:Uncharacterized protein n=1 Tax=Prochlorococcus marinus (strain NATL1A) TaxID=167555 RepID=A2C303_PROM1|nr:Hypothetical protein NATL1_13051 [Prochlorococcus marinus str. NATL1A]
MIPAGKAKISTTDRKTIKSSGNLPIPHSEKANARGVICIINLCWSAKIYMRLKNFKYRLSKSY